MRESKKENTEADEQNDGTKKGMPNQRKRMFVNNDSDLLGLIKWEYDDVIIT